MIVHILHKSLVANNDTYYPDLFDAGKYVFYVIEGSRWGKDESLLSIGGHGSPNSPDVIVAHSSVFEYDLIRMLRFILEVRIRAPWMVFILLISREEEMELNQYPSVLRNHFSKYFQFTDSQFSIENIHSYIASNFSKIETLVIEKRRKIFGREILSRTEIDQSVKASVASVYDFAISFSGAQRAQARELANSLKGKGCNVFFDEFESSNIVGKNLSEELYKVYNEQATYCIIIVSNEYKVGPWTNQERRAALDKAISKFSSSYIIPIKIDEVELPGLSSSIAYLKWNNNVTELSDILYKKLVSEIAPQ